MFEISPSSRQRQRTGAHVKWVPIFTRIASPLSLSQRNIIKARDAREEGAQRQRQRRFRRGSLRAVDNKEREARRMIGAAGLRRRLACVKRHFS